MDKPFGELTLEVFVESAGPPRRHRVSWSCAIQIKLDKISLLFQVSAGQEEEFQRHHYMGTEAIHFHIHWIGKNSRHCGYFRGLFGYAWSLFLEHWNRCSARQKTVFFIGIVQSASSLKCYYHENYRSECFVSPRILQPSSISLKSVCITKPLRQKVAMAWHTPSSQVLSSSRRKDGGLIW